MFKYYEEICLEALRLRGIRHNFPLALLNVCIAGYKAARFMSLASIVAGPHFASCGVIAGCSAATTLIRVHSLDAFDTIPRSLNGVDATVHLCEEEVSLEKYRSFDAYIDDRTFRR